MTQIECCTDDESIYSVMPYVQGGELFDFIGMDGCLVILFLMDWSMLSIEI